MVRKLESFVSKESEILHSPFIPAEVREGDPITAELISSNSQQVKKYRVWRYSPFGVELVIDKHDFNQGDSYDLRVKIAKESTLYQGIVVKSLFEEGGNALAGFRTFAKQAETDINEEKRESTRFKCSEQFLPTGTAPTPGKFNDYMFFRVEDISASGMRIITSMRNKTLMRDQRLDVTLSIPCVGSIQGTVVIRRVDFTHSDLKEFLVLGVEFVKDDEILQKSLAEYLLQFGENVTVQSLIKEGFKLSEAYKRFDFSYVKSKEEYNEVLALRVKSYKAAKKINDDTSPEQMADEFDSRSRILIVKHGGKIVGSVRIIFHEDMDRLSYSRYFDVPPEVLPDRKLYAEASRFCTDPDYSGADIFYHLAEHMVLTTVKSGRKFILGGAAGTLVGQWTRCGFARLGVQYKNNDFGGMPHELILMDTHQVALGRGIDLKLWNRVFGRMVIYMIENKIISPTPFDLIRIQLIRFLNRFKS